MIFLRIVEPASETRKRPGVTIEVPPTTLPTTLTISPD